VGDGVGAQFVSAGAAVLVCAAAALLARAAFLAARDVRRWCAADRASERRHAASLRAFGQKVVAATANAIRGVLPRRCITAAAGALRRAGRPGELTAEELVALVLLSAAAFLLFGSALSFALGLGPAGFAGGPLFGAALPVLWVRDRARARRAAIARALPHDLDLLTLSVEAGLDFVGALARVVEKGRKGPLADELSVTLKELRLGRIREDALRDLATRVEMPALSSFAQALAQADRMGTPLGKVLRALATQLRGERTLRAEKLAAEAPVKLLLPLIGCIFPTIFLMLFGPIAYQVFFAGDF
jgi:tight adherence protein C